MTTTKTYYRIAFKDINGDECVGVERFDTRADAERRLGARLDRRGYVVESKERP